MNHEIKHLVFPTDFSDTSLAAMDYAVRICKKYEAELHAVHAVDSAAYAYAGVPGQGDLANELVMSARDRLAKLSLDFSGKRGGPPCHGAILEGDAGEEVAAYARKVKAQLIVMASHARGRVARFFLGSVADRILSLAPCAVLLTRAPAGSAKFRVRKDRGFRRILVPTDFSQTASAALDRALLLALDYKAELHLLHIVDDRDLHLLSALQRRDALRDVRARTEEKLEKFAELIAKGVHIQSVIKSGEPAKKIAQYAAAYEIDLVVMGSRSGQGELKKLFLGSVTDAVVRTVDCPVYIEPPVAKDPGSPFR